MGFGETEESIRVRYVSHTFQTAGMCGAPGEWHGDKPIYRERSVIFVPFFGTYVVSTTMEGVGPQAAGSNGRS